ncbi:MAG: PadR family transcriptional regulator [Caldilineaceae bacterium]
MHDNRRYDTDQPHGPRGGRRGGSRGGRRGGGEENSWDTPGERRGHGPERRGPGARGRDGERGGGRDRARRGDARYILLDALRDGPKHGYEIIKTLEERSGGRYVPSPGTVYPTLQYLEDQGFVRATEETDRRIYQLTDAGQAELDAQAPQVTAFWARINGSTIAPATQQEVVFLQDELDHLERVVWSGLRLAIAGGQQETIRRVRGAVEECQDKVRAIIAAGGPHEYTQTDL